MLPSPDFSTTSAVVPALSEAVDPAATVVAAAVAAVVGGCGPGAPAVVPAATPALAAGLVNLLFFPTGGAAAPAAGTTVRFGGSRVVEPSGGLIPNFIPAIFSAPFAGLTPFTGAAVAPAFAAASSARRFIFSANVSDMLFSSLFVSIPACFFAIFSARLSWAIKPLIRSADERLQFSRY